MLTDGRTDGRTDGLTDGRTDGRKIGRLYRTLLQAGAIKTGVHRGTHYFFLFLLKNIGTH